MTRASHRRDGVPLVPSLTRTLTVSPGRGRPVIFGQRSWCQGATRRARTQGRPAVWNQIPAGTAMHDTRTSRREHNPGPVIRATDRRAWVAEVSSGHVTCPTNSWIVRLAGKCGWGRIEFEARCSIQLSYRRAV